MMKTYIGIDLGTTNSAICSYEDGRTRIWKSPEQNDVTPSAIYIDRRGSKYVGTRAYNAAPRSPGNVAVLFKRFMGTTTPIKLPAVDITKTPEECSAEILRTLFGYLPEELREALRNDPEVGIVITVPAAFDQMQKKATMEAAEQAGIGEVALLQEPVAAVMSVMKARNTDGTFLIYDLGGGTLDIALAESISGSVNLLACGGISMCGGRDFDRLLFDNVVKPWLCKKFDLPEGWSGNPAYKPLRSLATWAAERAKIELSSREEAVIDLQEDEVKVQDQSNQDIYIHIPIQRSTLTGLIQEKVVDSIGAARETLEEAGLSPHDVERIVFIGGPTHYKPLRDQVSRELGIDASTEVNPMTAVAEGAALFAESIDWRSENRSQKSTSGKLVVAGALDLQFNYKERTPGKEAKISIQAQGEVTPGTEYQVDSPDTGWTSGRLPLKDGATIAVLLSRDGENRFKVSVFDDVRGRSTHEIFITRTAATVDAIPASHSIGLVVLDKLGGAPVMQWLVRKNDLLPKKGTGTVYTAKLLKAGTSDSLNFQMVQGESETPRDNVCIGVLKVNGSDFDDGVIYNGAKLDYDFEMLDSGVIKFKVSVPSVRFRSEAKDFYSRQEGQIDYADESERVSIREEGERARQRLTELEGSVDDQRLEQAHKKLEESLLSLDTSDADPERVKEANEGIVEARRLMAQVRKDHCKPVRQLELEKVGEDFALIRQYARPSEKTEFDNLARTAQRSIDRNDSDFDNHLRKLNSRNSDIRWRQDGYIIELFNSLKSQPERRFSDAAQFKELVKRGKRAIKNDNIDELRQIVIQFFRIWISIDTPSDDDFIVDTNILRG